MLLLCFWGRSSGEASCSWLIWLYLVRLRRTILAAVARALTVILCFACELLYWCIGGLAGLPRRTVDDATADCEPSDCVILKLC